jgi:methionyl-tRNA synthetase
MKNNFYITTTLPYINADAHIGFAMEIIQADVLARFHRALGDEVFFNTGTDEHGLKIYQKAQEAVIDVQEFCNEKAVKWKELKNVLNLSYDNFIRTTDGKHVKAAQEFWKRCEKNGDIYKKNYKVKYCVGCELEKTESELVNECCPLHPGKDLEIIDEENYFFRFSKHQEKLLELYRNNSDLVKPKRRFNEIIKFVERGLEDFSISRVKEKMPWGVPVPGDDDQVMYVWFDALVNYISAIGWPENMEKFNKWWPVMQLAGKDNLRQQSAMWQAMLMSADLPPSKQIFINGFINSGGQKMSKSLGNVISPQEMVEKFGVDGTRYLLLSMGGNFGEDFDVTWGKMTEKYNADLANGLGNLVSRVVKLSQNFEFRISNFESQPKADPPLAEIFNNQFSISINNLELNQALGYTWRIIKEDDKYVEDNKPWELAKNDSEKFKVIMVKLTNDLYLISELLVPFMPETSEKIKKSLKEGKVEPLFKRI